jgi:hypothetical protein
MLAETQIDHFITEGFIRIDHAFSKNIASQVVEILWNDIPFDRANRETWTEPVIRLGMYSQKPFIDSINKPELHTAFDQLVGIDKWIPCQSVGTFPVRFPTNKQPIDTGKHVDASFPGDDPTNYFDWRINVKSKGRALLMLILYSDVGEADAPTVIYNRSHIDVANILSAEGDSGLSFTELANKLNDIPAREETLATGEAGTIYLCHPFLVHSAQSHQGKNPKFMAQPPLLLKSELMIEGSSHFSPVERAIRVGSHEVTATWLQNPVCVTSE